MNTEKFSKEMIIKAADRAYTSGLTACYEGAQLAFYMFIEGMKYQKTGILPKNELQDLVDSINSESK